MLSLGVNYLFYTSKDFLIKLKGLVLLSASFKLRKGQIEMEGES